MHRLSWRGWLVGCLFCALFAFHLSGISRAAACSGPISLTDATPYTQNFDSLATNGTTNLLTLPGWCLSEVGTSAFANGQYRGRNGASQLADVYSFGDTGSSERALGSRLSDSLVPSFGVSFVNNTGQVITGFEISYRGEEWRLGTDNSDDRLDFQYSLDAIDWNTGSWTEVDALDFVTPDKLVIGPKDGNTITTSLSATITGLNIASGGEFSIRWIDVDATGSDDGLGVDDFSLTPLLEGSESTPPPVTIDASATMTMSASATATILDSVTVTSTPISTASTPTGGEVGSLRIRDIQGTGHLSPLIGAAEVGVQDVPGIVTAKRSNGFYIQDPDLSGDTTGEASSEAMFVFTGTSASGAAIRDSVEVGVPVLVSGTIAEFRPGFPPNPAACNVRTISDLGSCSGPGLSITQLVGRNAQSLVVEPWACEGVCAISPTIIGLNGRIPPNMVLNTEAANIETGGLFNASTDGIDFYESLEGMRVLLNWKARVVGPSASFTSGTEVWVVADNFASSNNTPNPRGGLTISETDYYNPERIRISTKTGAIPMGAPLPDLNVGAVIEWPVEGIVDYSFNNFEVISLNTSYTITQSPLTKEVTSLVRNGPLQLTIATFNVENLGGTATNAAFETRADIIVNNLLSPDIVILEEMQDNNGQTAGGEAADITFAKLIDAIVSAGGPTYAYRQIDPASGNVDGGAPNGNIRIGFLYRPDRGITFVSRPAGDFDDALAITCEAGIPTPNLNPGRIDPTNAAFSNSRKPIVGEFAFNGETLFIIGNHWNSKGGDDLAFGNVMPPTESSRIQRDQQATVVRDFVNSILACDPTANVIVAGDLNDFQFSPPVTTLVNTTPALTIMNALLPADERYSYIYQGTAQSLDHVIVSPNVLTDWEAQYDTVHVNAEFFDQVSDHDPSLILMTADLDLQQSPLPIVVTNTTPILSWSQLTWASSYEIQLDDSITFDSPVTYTASGTSLTLPSPGLLNGTYYWRVRGQSLASLGGQFGAYSPVSAFTIEAD